MNYWIDLQIKKIIAVTAIIIIAIITINLQLPLPLPHHLQVVNHDCCHYHAITALLAVVTRAINKALACHDLLTISSYSYQMVVRKEEKQLRMHPNVIFSLSTSNGYLYFVNSEMLRLFSFSFFGRKIWYDIKWKEV